MTVVIGTAGHIDHGKTTLLRALTGIDADRLPEERARGMTIDVGYAHLRLDDGTELDFVDVPGHDRLVGNMLVGAGEIDAALLVVAADDGPRAQTIEHLELLDALGIDLGVVVVTKTDVVAADRVMDVADAARGLLAGTTLRHAPVLAVSATTGDGLADLRTALIAVRDRVLAARSTAEPDSGESRLAIDRVFSIRGRGTVVTGSLRGGGIQRGDVLRVVPGDRVASVRVREVQVHGLAVDRAGAGRTALNVAGEGVDTLARGMVLTTDRSVVATDRLLVAIRLISIDRLPRDRARVAVHAGTSRVAAVVGRSGREAVDLPDGRLGAILRLAEPIAAAPGDRLALRRPSPARTIGGAIVLDPDPPRGVARRRATAMRLAALAAAPPGSPTWAAAHLDLHGAVGSPAPAVAQDVAAAVDEAIAAAVGEHGERRTAELLRLGGVELRRRVGQIGDQVGSILVGARLESLASSGRLARSGDRWRAAGVAASERSPELDRSMDRLVAALSSASPPALSAAAREAACPPEGVRALEREGRIVRVDDELAWAADTWRDLAARALAMATTEPLTPAVYRDATGTSRKYVLAILEDLDRRAILLRTPAGHVPGPRAAQLATRTTPVAATTGVP